jgi:hypothetical protein
MRCVLVVSGRARAVFFKICGQAFSLLRSLSYITRSCQFEMMTNMSINDCLLFCLGNGRQRPKIRRDKY